MARVPRNQTNADTSRKRKLDDFDRRLTQAETDSHNTMIGWTMWSCALSWIKAIGSCVWRRAKVSKKCLLFFTCPAIPIIYGPSVISWPKVSCVVVFPSLTSRNFQVEVSFPNLVLQPAVGVSRPIQHGGSSWRFLVNSMRLSELMTWQESWCHPSQSGFRSLHDCFDSWYPLALQVERALLNRRFLNGCFLDYEKAFDLLPLHEIILPLAKLLGLPCFFVNSLSNLYSNLIRFFKHPKGFGSAIKSNRGIVQGCPISVVLLNLLLSIFLRFAEHDYVGICPQAYADDISASAPSVPGISYF